MPPWTIAHIIGGGDFGGAEKHVLTLLKHLDKKTLHPILICLQKGPLHDLAAEENIPVRCLPMGGPLNLSIMPKLIRTLREFRVDLIHNHGARANLFGRLSAAWLKRPNISTVHSSLAFDYLSAASARAALALDRLTLPLASGIITVSQFLADEVSSRGGKNIRVIYNAYTPDPNMTPEKLSSLRSAFRRAWSIHEEATVLGSIARLHPTKGLEYFIKAAAIISRRLPNTHLLLVGRGPLQEALQKQAHAAGIAYTFTGFLPDVYPALSAMDLFILPSLSEGMGLALLEAMHAGLPIIATHVGGIPEVIRNEQEGLLIPPRDPEKIAAACLKVLHDPAFTETLKISGHARWPQFSREAMLRQTEEFYLELLSNDHSLKKR